MSKCTGEVDEEIIAKSRAQETARKITFFFFKPSRYTFDAKFVLNVSTEWSE